MDGQARQQLTEYIEKVHNNILEKPEEKWYGTFDMTN